MPPDNFQDFQPPQTQPQPQPTAPSPTPDYNFIMNPEKPPRGSLLPSSSSMARRIVVVAGGLLILIIVFAIAKSLLTPKPKMDLFVSVAQDQQEIIHLTSNPDQQQNLSTANQNLAATAAAAVGSSQTQLISYLKSNHFKLSATTLNSKVSQTFDQQLSNAAAAGIYDQTFQTMIANQLKIYLNDMRLAYNGISGPKGHALLQSDFNQAQLLLHEVTTPSS